MVGTSKNGSGKNLCGCCCSACKWQMLNFWRHCRFAKVQETDVQNLKVGWHVCFMKDFVSRFSLNPQDMSVEK